MTVFDVIDTVGVALVVLGMVLFVCIAVHEAFRPPRELDDEPERGESEKRRERAQERQARAMLRPPRDIVVAASGREPTYDDFLSALRSGADL